MARLWINLWNEGDPDSIPLAEGFTHTSPFGRVEGRQKYLDWVKPLARGTAGGLRVLRTLARGDEATIHYEIRTPSGVVPACDWIVVSGGQIREIHSFYDAASMR